MAKKRDEHKLKLRNLLIEDYDEVRIIMEAVYSTSGGAWSATEYAALLTIFPEGQICVDDNGKVVGFALGLIVDYNRFGDNHTYEQITGYNTFDTHTEDGDTFYGTDVCVHTQYRDMRLGRRLYDARKELCEKLNLRSIIAGGRIPGYKNYSDTLTPRKYIDKVKTKEIYDPILTFQLANDFHVRKVITDYLPEDLDSRSYATLLEWNNIYFEEKSSLFGGRKAFVRIGVVQWQMRQFTDVNDLMQQFEFFVDTVAGYKCDVVLFPEFFNAPLMAQFNAENAADAVRALAEYTEDLRERILNLAISYNVNIVAGSMPVYEDETLYNVSYLCKRDGTWDSQYKIHVTPDEAFHWGMKGGSSIQVFDTDIGKIGILICYDVEFPELSRILAENSMDILFVPYWTDTKNAYQRVRLCAQARAVENECYVAISGSVGNLPRVENMDIQYSQAAVFSPSDVPFPHDAIVAEATPNTETTLIAELNLDLLKETRMHGAVRNLKDRRKDLYKVEWIKKKR
jgi:predicted amidohydrolase/ribosomal protein S18 acetylase RimI-like enzyme